MVDTDGKVVILDMASFSEQESDGTVEVTTNGKKRRDSSKTNGNMSNSESRPLIDRSSSTDASVHTNEINDPEFRKFVRAAESAIEAGVNPVMIAQGSSGSYFVKNIDEDTIGVFKPKDEEPYGHLNPKWTKWVHKLCCPCCFGRSCLVPNQGYLSEAGASIIDEKLGLGIVPKTMVVHLASESFHYHKADRMRIKMRRFATEQWPDTIGRKLSTGLPLKVGSFQTFVKGYKDAQIQLDEFQNEPIHPQLEKPFQLQFERLVVLDYIIRNTDRGNDNWLVKYDKPINHTEDEVAEEERYCLVTATTEGGSIKIAAIDNGLAFPFKHPDEWRAYPFYWAWLPMAKTPFSEDTAILVLDKLKDQEFVQSLVDELRRVFKRDKGFDRATFEKQMAVMRGQILNLIRALEEKKTPWELVNMPPIAIEAVKEGRTHKFIQKVRERAPFFKGF